MAAAFVLEGGSIDVNARIPPHPRNKACSASASQRNHGFTREDYAHVFRSYLGVTQFSR